MATPKVVPPSGAASVNGVVYLPDGGWTLQKSQPGSPASSGNNAFIAAVAGKKIRVLAYRIQASDDNTIKFTDTDGNTLSQSWEFNAREGCSITGPSHLYEFETAVGKGVQVNLVNAVAAHVTVHYVEVPE